MKAARWMILSLICSLSQLLFAQTGTMVYLFKNGKQSMGVTYTMHFTAETSMAYTERSTSFQQRREVSPDPEKENHYNMRVIISDQESYTYYRHLRDSLLVSRNMVGGIYTEPIILTEPLTPIDWQITEETKAIGDYVCHLAKGTYKNRKYYAWFTYQIPVSHGPWKLHGLPGLILEAHDEEELFYFIALTVSLGDKAFDYPIKAPEMGKKLSWDTYAEMHVQAQAIMDKKVAARTAAQGSGRSASVDMGDYRTRYLEGRAFEKWYKSKQKTK